MKTEQRQNLKEIMNSLEGVELKEKHGGKLRFRLHMNEQMRNAPLEALELGQRSYNCLKRAGYGTVGELTEAIAEGRELKGIRNCGAKSVREIMEQLFLFQYHSLRPERREAYLLEVVRMNAVSQRDAVFDSRLRVGESCVR